MLLEAAFNEFIKDRQSYCSAVTVEFYKENLQRFFSFLEGFSITSVEELDQDVLKDYLLYLRSRNIKNTSIRCYFRAIHAFCFFLIDQEYIPYFRYKLKLPRPDPDPVIPLTVNEVKNILLYINNNSLDDSRIRNLLMFRFMLDMGMRSSEVRHLRRRDILENRIQIVNSKCNKSRLLPVPEVIMDLLSQYDLDRFKPDDYIIPISKNGIKLFFNRLKRHSVSRVYAHLLRHTFATSYMLQRHNLEFLRIYMGHEDYATTKFYLHVADQCFLTSYDIYKISDVFL